MTVTFRAETVTFDVDEDGFSMVIEDTEGFTHRVNIQGCAAALMEAAVKTIGPWVLEMRQAEILQQAIAKLESREEILGGYDPGDPKYLALAREIPYDEEES